MIWHRRFWHVGDARGRRGAIRRAAGATATSFAVSVGFLAASPPAPTQGSTSTIPLSSLVGASLTPLSSEVSRGHWFIRTSADGETLVWRSPKPIPTTDARPEFRVGTRVVGYPEVGKKDRTLSIPVPALGDTDPTSVEAWLGLHRLDSKARSLPAAPVPPTSTPTGRVHSTDPGTPGSYEVESFDYSAPDLPWPDFDSPMEVLGHAVLPVGVRNAPLVVFLHGRHIACYGPGNTGFWPCKSGSEPVPSYLGYEYLQELLASQGYATVSISANAVNAQDGNTNDGGARARATLVRHHLQLLDDWSSDPAEARWGGRLDLGDVVLVGHSRGGEGVNQAAIDTPANAPYHLDGQVLIAPTDFAYQTAPYLPTELLLGYCDGDVSDLQGQRYVDAEPLLAPDDPTLRSSVLLFGANHNYFNTEWTPKISQAPSEDDWWDRKDPVCGSKASDTRLTAAEQRRAAMTFVAAGVHAFIGDDEQSALGYLDAGGPVAVPDAGPAVALTHALGGNRSTASLGAGASVAGSAQACLAGQPDRGYYQFLPPPEDQGSLCGLRDYYRQPHWTSTAIFPASVHAAYAQDLPEQLELTWDSRGTEGGFTFDKPMSLASGRSRLDLRVIADPVTGPARFRVVLGSGGTTDVGPVVTLSPLPGSTWLGALWAQTLRVDPADFPGVELSHVDMVMLRSASRSGRVWLLDASLRRGGSAPAPDRSLPRITLGSLVQPEGGLDDGGTALLPFTVTGKVTQEARFDVAVDQSTVSDWATPQFASVLVEPGQTEGYVSVQYEADEIDDLANQVELVHAVAKYGLVMSGFVGVVDIQDDDPSPTVTLRPVRTPVHYGDNLVFRLRLSAPVDYWVVNTVSAVRDDDRPLRTSDVPRKWLRSQVGSAPDDVPLHKVWKYGYVDLPPGTTVAKVKVPTLADPLHDYAKSLTIRFSAPDLAAKLRATVRVLP